MTIRSLDSEITAISLLHNPALIAVAQLKKGLFIRAIETKISADNIARYKWDETTIWGIYEHYYGKQDCYEVWGIYIVHTTGVQWLKHSGKYRDLKL